MGMGMRMGMGMGMDIWTNRDGMRVGTQENNDDKSEVPVVFLSLVVLLI